MFLTSLARAWVDVDDRDRAASLLETAHEAASKGSNIEQPGLYAQVAAVYHLLGEGEESDRIAAHALLLAESLKNSRPRAAAVSQICREMGKEGWTPGPGQRARLDSLYGGLGDPW